MLDTEPELPRCRRIDRFGDIDSECSPFDKAEHRQVDTQAGSDRVRDITDEPTVGVDAAHVIERREPDISRADTVIENVPIHVARYWPAQLGVSDPQAAPLPLREI